MFFEAFLQSFNYVIHIRIQLSLNNDKFTSSCYCPSKQSEFERGGAAKAFPSKNTPSPLIKFLPVWET